MRISESPSGFLGKTIIKKALAKVIMYKSLVRETVPELTKKRYRFGESPCLTVQETKVNAGFEKIGVIFQCKPVGHLSAAQVAHLSEKRA